MSEKDRHGKPSQGKPFTLRPSVLSSTSGSSDSSVQPANKSSLLRPSALTEIADKIESSLSDVKKRKGDSEDKTGDGVNQEQILKKPKVDSDASHEERHLKLTESLIPPKGIGTFGFINAETPNKLDGSAQGSINESKDSYGFIFGESAKDEVTDFQDISNSEGINVEKDDKNSSSVSGKEQELRLADIASKHMSKEKATKIHLTEIEVITGEEGERNVLQMQCKLHLFSHDKSKWIEKGRGTLKLNDICKSEKYDIFQSRIVFRRQGSHQVVLNTLLWPEMCYDKGSNKSLRLTALDAETEKINIFLVTGAPRDVAQLHTAIDRRVIALKRNQNQTVVDTTAVFNRNEKPEEDIHSDGLPTEAVFTSKGTPDDHQNESLTNQNDSSSSNDSLENAN